MKIILSESFISAHFAQRFKERLPEGIRTDIKDKIFNIISRIKDYTFVDFFSKNKIQIELIKLRTFNLYAIVNDNVIITMVRSKRPYGKLPLIENFLKFEEELKKIKISFQTGKFYYKIEYENSIYYFIINDNKVIDYVSNLDKDKLSEYIKEGYEDATK